MDLQENQRVNSGGRRKAVLLCLGSVIFSLLIAKAALHWFLSPPYILNRWDKAFTILHRADPRPVWILSFDSMKFPYRLVDENGSVQDDLVYPLENEYLDSWRRLEGTLPWSLETPSAGIPHELLPVKAARRKYPASRKSNWKYRIRYSGILCRILPRFENSWDSPKDTSAYLLTDVWATV
jgi:hypothetical protein